VAEALNLSFTRQALIEKYLTGIEFGAQVIIYEDELLSCICHNDIVTPPPVSTPIGHSVPSRLGPEIQQEAARVCQTAARALGIKSAVCNADLMLCTDGVHIIEFSPRAGATGLPEIIHRALDLNLYKVILDLAEDRKPDTNLEPQRAAAVHLIGASQEGLLKGIYLQNQELSNKDNQGGQPDFFPPLLLKGESKSSALPPLLLKGGSKGGLYQITLDYPPGTPVKRFSVGPDRLGQILVTAETADDAEHIIFQILTNLRVEVE